MVSQATKIPTENKKSSTQLSAHKLQPLIKSKTMITTLSSNLSTQAIAYAYKEEQNKEFNDYMEDVGLIKTGFANNPKHHLFGIFDGHGGRKCAQLCTDKYPDILAACLKENPTNINKCITKSFELIDKEALEHKCIEFGNTATIIYLAGKLIYCANVGDSRCVIVSSDSVTEMTKDDKCSDPNEVKRIQLAGGKIIDERVGGLLAITRAIGDHELKNQGLICTPHIEKHLINPHDRYCIVASDGVWDALNNNDILKMAQESKTSNELVEKIVNTSVELGSSDNISCIVIAFHE